MPTIGGKYNDYFENISANKLETHEVIFFGGYCTNMPPTFQILNPLNLTTVVFPSVADYVKISSTNVNDTLAGSGVRLVLVTGLDENYIKISEYVATAGTTAVSTANKYIRILEIRGVSAGSLGTAAGTVYCGVGAVTGGVPDTIYRYFLPEDGVGHVANYTVPGGFKLFMSNVNVVQSNTNGTDVFFSFNSRPFGSIFNANSKGVVQGNLVVQFTPFYTLDEKTDVTLMVTSSSNSGAAALVSGYLRAKSLDI